MTTIEQRIAIAEWMGWKFVKMPHGEHGYYYFKPNAERIEMAKIGNCPGATPLYEIPEFCEDLNAMHEAENKLTTSQCRDYFRALKSIIVGDKNVEPNKSYLESMLTSSELSIICPSQQRSEALCRTLWPERFQ